MNLLSTYKVDKEKKLFNQIQDITNAIENISKEKYLFTLKKKLILITNLPENVIDREIKLFLSLKFNFDSGEFRNFFELKKLITASISFFGKLFYIVLFSKKKNKKRNFDVIVDDITSAEIPLLRSLLENFKSHLLIGNEKIKTQYNYLKNPSLKYYDKNLVLSLLFSIITIFFYSLKISIQNKKNILPLTSFILFRFLKYQSLFIDNISKYLIQTRPTMRSSIRNYLFKKNGGKTTACIQKSLKVYGSWDLFHDTDILFSHGKGSFLNDNFLGNEIKKIIPVGSLSLEQYWSKKAKVKTLNFDVVNLGCNILSNFEDILKDKNFKNEYYEQFNWLVKLSKKFTQLKIGIKHHANLKLHDEKEIKIIKNSRVERIVKDNSKDINRSYNIAIQSKFVCTWCSITAYELLSLGKPCFFLDPNGTNESFFQKDKANDSWRIKTYEEFEKRVVQLVYENKIIKINNSDYFCLDSKNVSNKITHELINF